MVRGIEGTQRIEDIIRTHYSKERSEDEVVSELLLDIMRFCSEGKTQFPVALSMAREAFARERERQGRAKRGG
jgi:hypothetical protein